MTFERDTIVENAGWTNQTLLELALEFIETTGADELFTNWLEERAAMEDA